MSASVRQTYSMAATFALSKRIMEALPKGVLNTKANGSSMCIKLEARMERVSQCASLWIGNPAPLSEREQQRWRRRRRPPAGSRPAQPSLRGLPSLAPPERVSLCQSALRQKAAIERVRVRRRTGPQSSQVTEARANRHRRAQRSTGRVQAWRYRRPAWREDSACFGALARL